MVINIRCSDDVGKAILRTIQAVQAVGNQTDIDVDVELGMGKKVREARPRVSYRAVSPADAPDALLALGEHTIKGIIFQDIVKATVEGVPATERGIAEARSLNTKTVQARIVGLRQAGLIESVPLT